MQITRIAAAGYSAELPEPAFTAQEDLARANAVVVTVETADGLAGHGLARSADVKAVADWVGRLGAGMVGADARAHAVMWQRMFERTLPRSGWLPPDGDGPPPPAPRGARGPLMAALGAIDIALWDLKGKAAGMPVWALLGGDGKPLPAYATGGYWRPGSGEDLGALAAEYAGYAAAGFRAVKLKAGWGPLAKDAARLEVVRQAVGPDVAIMLDLNAPYTVDEAIEAAHVFQPYGVTWLEEVLTWEHTAPDYARLAAASPIPIAHGERELTRVPIRDLIDAGAIRYVQFDATRAAGLTEALRVANYAAMKGVLVAPHSAPEIQAHLVSALGPAAAPWVEAHPDPRRDPLADALFPVGGALQDGWFHLTEATGLGFAPDFKLLERWRAT